MSNISDLVIDLHDRLNIIVDIEVLKNNTFLFHLYNLKTEELVKWFEPFNKQLNPGYWVTIA